MCKNDSIIPPGFIVFISGVPGVGKTTTSYELLKKCNEFRIIQETDIVREILRGYNTFLTNITPSKKQDNIDIIQIPDHNKLLSFDEAKKQCEIMYSSLEFIVCRQQRKGIPSIINGVHIIPETLNGLVENQNIIYINLYINNEQALYKRLLDRDPTSYMMKHIPFIFQTNIDLYKSTNILSQQDPYVFNNIDITSLNLDETFKEITRLIQKRINLE